MPAISGRLPHIALVAALDRRKARGTHDGRFYSRPASTSLQQVAKGYASLAVL